MHFLTSIQWLEKNGLVTGLISNLRPSNEPDVSISIFHSVIFLSFLDLVPIEYSAHHRRHFEHMQRFE